MKNEYNDLPPEEIVTLMEKLITEGFSVYVKWVCEGCGERVTCNNANSFFLKGWKHEGWKHEDCGFVSFPKRYGLGR
jgi:hypothetical protein